MAIRTSAISGIAVHDIQTLFSVGTVAGLSDGQLLRRFKHRRDDEGQAAFAALVRRHGSMVLRVCNGVLRDPTDAEDAFQATFLVLARKAGSIREPESIGSWLYGVALRIAANQRAARIKRQVQERRLAAMAPAAATEEDRHDLERALLEEVDRLPERYRAPIVLCYLEGLTHAAAAHRLSWPVGTVEGRLARARGLLRSRLTRRGLAPALGTLAATAWAEAGFAGYPGFCAESVTAAAVDFADGNTAVTGKPEARAAMLARDVLRTMRLSALKTTAAVVMIVALSAAVAFAHVSLSQDSGLLPQPAKALAEPAPSAAKPLRVLILQGTAWGWESRYLFRALAMEPDLELELQVVRKPVQEGQGALDDAVFRPGGYGVYILSDIPADAFTRRQQERLRLLVARGAGLMMLGGHSSFGAGGWADTAVAHVLPVQLRPDHGLNEPEGGLKYVLTTEGRKHAFLLLGPTEAQTAKIWDDLPAIPEANRLGHVKPSAVILVQTPAGDPLLVSQDVGQGRVLAVAGQTWTWARSGDTGRSAHRRFWRQALLWVGHQE
jgi:RNA polymerase sigma factor (sigma-70 family)